MGAGYGCSYCDFTYSSPLATAIIFIQLQHMYMARQIRKPSNKEAFLYIRLVKQ